LDERAFATLVLERTPSADLSPIDPVRAGVVVVLRATEDMFVGQLQIQRRDGTRFGREVRDASCTEVAQAIAFIVALALSGQAENVPPEPAPPAPAAPIQVALPAARPVQAPAGWDRRAGVGSSLSIRLERLARYRMKGYRLWLSAVGVGVMACGGRVAVGDLGDSGTGGAGGTAGAPGTDAEADGFDDITEAGSPGLCASGVRWKDGMPPSDKMNPGVPCMGSGCHTAQSTTVLTAAGTIYPLNGSHDENNCNGLDSTMVGAAIAFFDPDTGGEFVPRLPINSAGNFFTTRVLLPSYNVRVIVNGRVIDMIAPVTDGNCNYCHSAEGTMGAAGRILPAPVN
jgi:hypothetical protein